MQWHLKSKSTKRIWNPSLAKFVISTDMVCWSVTTEWMLWNIPQPTAVSEAVEQQSERRQIVNATYGSEAGRSVWYPDSGAHTTSPKIIAMSNNHLPMEIRDICLPLMDRLCRSPTLGCWTSMWTNVVWCFTIYMWFLCLRRSYSVSNIYVKIIM